MWICEFANRATWRSVFDELTLIWDGTPSLQDQAWLEAVLSPPPLVVALSHRAPLYCCCCCGESQESEDPSCSNLEAVALLEIGSEAVSGSVARVGAMQAGCCYSKAGHVSCLEWRLVERETNEASLLMGRRAAWARLTLG